MLNQLKILKKHVCRAKCPRGLNDARDSGVAAIWTFWIYRSSHLDILGGQNQRGRQKLA